MPFTMSVTNSGSLLDSGDISLSLSPTTALFSPGHLMPGTSIGSPQLAVANNGTDDEYYFIFADWAAVSPSTARQAQILVDNVNISIEASPATSLYSGTISGLIDQPAGGRLLISPQDDLLTFVVSMPSTTGVIAEDIDLSVNFLFIGQSSPVV